MSIDAVGSNVQLSPDEPFGVRRLPLEDFSPRCDPIELLGFFGPERFRIATGFVVDAGRRNVGAARELRWRLELPFFL